MEWLRAPAPTRSTGELLASLALGLAQTMGRRGTPGQAQEPAPPASPSLANISTSAPPPPTYDPGSWQDRLAQRESGGNYGISNDLGYLGKYQFGEAALADLGLYVDDNYRDNDWGGTWTLPGVSSRDTFLQNPQAQEEAFSRHTARLENQIRAAGLDQLIGQTVDGVPITMGGLISAAHLGGFGGLRSWLRGGRNARDANGTSLLDYMRMGAG
jgi:hypothetical protein